MSTVGSKAVNRLKCFVKSLQDGQDISKRFTCRSLNIETVESVVGFPEEDGSTPSLYSIRRRATAGEYK